MQGREEGSPRKRLPPHARDAQDLVETMEVMANTRSGYSSTVERFVGSDGPLDKETVTDYIEHGRAEAKRLRSRRSCVPSRGSPERG